VAISGGDMATILDQPTCVWRYRRQMAIQAVPRTGQDKTVRHDFDKARPRFFVSLLASYRN
jgi:hypothetical protein